MKKYVNDQENGVKKVKVTQLQHKLPTPNYHLYKLPTIQ